MSKQRKRKQEKNPLSFNNVVGHILGVIPTFDPSIGLFSTCTCIKKTLNFISFHPFILQSSKYYRIIKLR